MNETLNLWELDQRLFDKMISIRNQLAMNCTIDDESLFVGTREENDEVEYEPARAVPAPPTTLRDINEALIDPALLGETSRNFSEAFDGNEPNLQVDDANPLDSSDHPPEIITRMSQYRTGRTILRPVTLVDAVSDKLLSGDPASSDSELADLMIQSFNHMYPSDHFQPGQEPLPGSRNCGFCGEDLTTLIDRSSSRHSHWCHKKALSMVIVHELHENYAHTNKCTWVNRKGKVPKECGRTEDEFKSSLHWTRHLQSHTAVRGNNTTIQCRFGECASAEDIIQFKSYEALHRHLVIEHKVHVSRAESTNGGAERLIWWCPICFQFINQLETDIDEHARSHIKVINDIIHSDGYIGLQVNHLAVIPIFCIFCVHNITKSESIRFINWLSDTNLAEHVHDHVNSHSIDTFIPCPASIATEDGIVSNCSALPMKPTELTAHLLSVHEIKSQRKNTRRKQDDTDKESDQPMPPKKGNTHASHHILQSKHTNSTLRQTSRQGTSTKTPEDSRR